MIRWLERVARRVYCAATLGHDPDFDPAARVDRAGWWTYPCRKCGTLILPSVFAGVDRRVDERDA